MAEVVLAWSGGTDAALVLRELRRDPSFEVVELLTTLDPERDRSTMHGVRRELYDRQAEAIGLPIRSVDVPAGAGNDVYEDRMAATIADYEERDIDRIAFGDIRLDDVRAYREELLADATLDGLWPIWGRDPHDVVAETFDAGFRATVVCVDGDVLDESVLGRTLSESLLDDVPESVDPRGENGEFHTFVHDGPLFDRPIEFEVRTDVDRDIDTGPFLYCDLRPA